MKIALIGAGGKMGVRLAKNLSRSHHEVSYVEVSPVGIDRLRQEAQLEVTTQDDAVDGADVVIMAVPDTLIGKISATIVPHMRSGAMMMLLDPAAPCAGHLPERADVVYFVTHPCHPSIFNEDPDEAARLDRFGGIAAKQAIINALMQGDESQYPIGAEVAEIIWAPVLRTHRVTVEQMALLEPALSETLTASLLAVMQEGIEEVARRGVPEAAARDFLLGHMNILGAVTFGHIPGAFSDACNKAIQFGKARLMRDDWKGIFDKAEVDESIRRIT
ncbi:phosphogluconate dehydrogenase C-terminal domain-containing protein [Castellaniella sp. S9]|uniref:phosphogluconate dehydrogenase C-terminal domain-containing protein n=1 Tax=Castellaniella sp. S9 TaxID=2993652 RepID=UPI0022B510BF|nr:phosphogluconate dehydrogenase C-terminal domain-containing protein [Castellaniella sp. S9]